MAIIPELSTNSFWSTRYSPSIVDTIKAGNSKPKQIDYNYQSLQLLSNLSVKNFQGQQEQYRNSITTFNDSVRSVSSSVKSLTASNLFSQKYVATSAGTAVTGDNAGRDDRKIVDVVQGLVTNYNSLHTTLSNNDTVTKRGKEVLSSVENVVSKTRSAEFASIGITLEKSTGELKLDEKKLADALDSSPEKVKGLLTGGASLGKTVERLSKELLNAPVNNYLKPPSILDNLNYSSPYNSRGWMAQQNNLAQGLFFNMTV